MTGPTIAAARWHPARLAGGCLRVVWLGGRMREIGSVRFLTAASEGGPRPQVVWLRMNSDFTENKEGLRVS